MQHLYICSLFSYRTTDLFADSLILPRLAETVEEALTGLDVVNRTHHPETMLTSGQPEWTGHQESASQVGDELVLKAAAAIQAAGGMALALANSPLQTSISGAPEGEVRSLAPYITNALPGTDLPLPPPRPVTDNPVVAGDTDSTRFYGFGP